MKSRRYPGNAFTRLELLFVIVALAFLVGILAPSPQQPRGKAYKVQCMNNLRILHQATDKYLYEWSHDLQNTNTTRAPFLTWTDYREPIGENVPGVKAAPSPEDRVFACPKDTFYYPMNSKVSTRISQPLHEQSNFVFTSYAYNAGHTIIPGTNNSPATTNFLGIAGIKLDSIAHPNRTVLLAEFPALAPYSWHNPKSSLSGDASRFNNAQDMLAFVDGHVVYTRMYYDGKKPAWEYNPPARYAYQWTGD
jgi:type II secretory pathway pseudopilin PulG